MKFNKIFILLLLIYSCVPKDLSQNYKKSKIINEGFVNQGFTLIYDNNLKKKKILTKSLNDRDLIIFQKNLKKNTVVKITNLINDKSLIAKVGVNSKYPNFYNSVISKRISKELEIDFNQPYVQIKQIIQNSTFIVKKAKTYEEEKEVANKAPVDDVSIKSISKVDKKIDLKSNEQVNEFKYIVKLGDFYFINTAKSLKKRILEELKIDDVKIDKISDTNFRVYLGPFDNLNSLKKGFNDISNLDFENIEILKL